MPSAPGLLARAAAPAALVALLSCIECVPAFQCRDDAGCDTGLNGRCVEGVCQYGDEPASTASTAAASSGVTGEGPTETGAASSTTDTGEPASCEPWVVLLEQTGKATGLALAPDGGVFVVGVSEATAETGQLRVMRLAADGSALWNQLLADTYGDTLDNDSDVLARVFLAPGGDELTVVYSLRKLNKVMMTSVKSGPYVHRVSASNGATIDVNDELSLSFRSIRGVEMPDPDTLLLSGEREDNIWYQRGTRDGAAWLPAWDLLPAPFDADAGFTDPAITQAITALPDAVIVGGSWDREGDHAYSGWLRRLAPADGSVACPCERENTGVMAIAPAGADAVHVAGFAQDEAQTFLWLAKLGATCPISCTPIWEEKLPGKFADAYVLRAELLRDLAYTLVPLADGGVIVGGTVDSKPWAALRAADGTWPWTMDPSPNVALGAVMAASLSADERCLTLAGSKDHLEFGARQWWVRRIPLP